jgi:hypothetical protein
LAIETTPEAGLRRPEPVVLTGGESPAAFELGALRLLACTAFAVLLICLLVLTGGPSESEETRSWLLAFVVAIPGGLALAAYQARMLAAAAPAALARALATGVTVLALAFLLRRLGGTDQLHHALIALASVVALAAPFLAARQWRDSVDCARVAPRAIAFASLAGLALLFVPSPTFWPDRLIGAVALAALMLLILHVRRPLPERARRPLDVAICVVIALVVIQLPNIFLFTPNLIHHHGFFLGPANDVLHGRAMIGDAWSQYGVGAIDFLALVFTVVPIGYGTLALIVVALTTAQYLCVYATLRLAGLGQVLAVMAISVAALGNLFSPINDYVVYPSATALRMGLPYLLVLFAVVGARYPARARAARVAILAVLAVGATWSFETFVYCAATYGALALVEAICHGTHIVRRVLRDGALGLAVSVAAVLLLSLLTLLFDGHLDWGPYFEYLRLYTVSGLGELPVVVFSAGPMMGAAIFVSAVTVLWLVRYFPWSLSAPMRAALAGFTGFAIATFTYYIGRSHPNNLLVLLVPVVALGGLWIQLLLTAPVARWRFVPIGALMLAAATIAVASKASVAAKWRETALVLAVPHQGGSLSLAFEHLAENPALDPRAPAAAALLDRLPPGQAATVLIEPELTTEVLMRAGRANLLPISNPTEDDLIQSSGDRVRAAAEALPTGTLLLTQPRPRQPGELGPVGLPREFNELQNAALAVLHRRFAFRLLQRTPSGIELVRLVLRKRGSP